MGLGMTHIPMEDDEEPRRRSSPRSYSVIDQLFERLTALSTQLESAVELSSTLQAQHTAAQSTISALESKVTALEGLVQAQSQPSSPIEATPPPPEPTPPPPPQPDSLTQVLNEWKKSVEGQWSSVREEWASERERLASAREEWENKVKTVETNLGTAAAKFDAGLASLALLQRQQQQQGQALGLSGNGDVGKGFPHGSGSGRGGLVTPPSPRSLSADSNRPRQRRKRSSSSRARGRSASRGEVDRGVESECSTTSLGRPYTPSLPDDSSDADVDADSLRKDSTDSNPNSLKDADGGVHQLETPESSVHRAPMTSLPWTNSPVTDSLASSIVKGDVNEDPVISSSPFSDPTTVSTAFGVVILSVAAAAVIWRVKPE